MMSLSPFLTRFIPCMRYTALPQPLPKRVHRDRDKVVRCCSVPLFADTKSGRGAANSKVYEEEGMLHR
jgi:hypothetical protein